MLLMIGLVGLLFTIWKFRKPGIPFASFITVFNRKEKLTDTGSKAYLVFLSIMLIGLVLNFATKH